MGTSVAVDFSNQGLTLAEILLGLEVLKLKLVQPQSVQNIPNFQPKRVG